MPIVPIQPGVGPSTQVTPVIPNSSTQSNLGQMIGHVLAWNPDQSASDVETLLNNAYRTIVDMRTWAGLMVRGQIAVPNVISTGTVSVTYGSPIVVGVGTSFDPTMSFYQFRVGFTTGFYNIIQINSATELTLDLPWGNPTQTNVSYQIMNNVVQLGYNVKRVFECLNQRQGYRLFTNVPQGVIDVYDTWRTGVGWTFLMSPREFNPYTGAQYFELYPPPTYQQTFPFLAYVQPPDLTDDAQAPYPFLRSDILEKMVISQVLLKGGPKQNRFYDQFTAQYKAREATADLQEAISMDDSQGMQGLLWDYAQYPFSQQGSTFLAQHDNSYDF